MHKNTQPSTERHLLSVDSNSKSTQLARVYRKKETRKCSSVKGTCIHAALFYTTSGGWGITVEQGQIQRQWMTTEMHLVDTVEKPFKWAHSDCNSLHKASTSPIHDKSHMEKGVGRKSHSKLLSEWKSLASGKERDSFLWVYLLMKLRKSNGRLHLQDYLVERFLPIANPSV